MNGGGLIDDVVLLLGNDWIRMACYENGSEKDENKRFLNERWRVT